MMGDIRGHATWSEPRVGMLFGEFYFVNSFEGQRKSKNFILGEKQKATGWLHPDLRPRRCPRPVPRPRRGRLPYGQGAGRLGRGAAPDGGAAGEPDGLPSARSQGRRRLHPRRLQGGRLAPRAQEGRSGWTSSADENPNSLAEERATRYLKQVGGAKRPTTLTGVRRS
jgi:hypothetical protein